VINVTKKAARFEPKPDLTSARRSRSSRLLGVRCVWSFVPAWFILFFLNQKKQTAVQEPLLLRLLQVSREGA